MSHNYSSIVRAEKGIAGAGHKGSMNEEAVSNVTSNDLHDRNSAFGFPLSYHILAIGGGTICG